MERLDTSRARLAFHLATFVSLGDRLPAPGTLAGSLPAAALWWTLVALVQPATFRLSGTTVGVVAATVAGIWAAGMEAQRRGLPDPGPVVVDEVAGQWLTYLVALPFLHLDGLRGQAMVVGAGFLAFRFFDVVKPWPASALERLPGGLGIMADDLAAGIMAGVVLAAVGHWQGW
jgi:phosphatidylglycerophosphatase A